jgi:uncharacterized protein (DUF1015 family)
MVTLKAFRALRPTRAAAAAIAAVPYDVVSVDEARALAANNPLSFLRVSRPELELPPGTNPYSDAVYDLAVLNFEKLRASSLELDDTPMLYVYRLRHGGYEQTGIAGCFSLDEYDNGTIKKHERTRPDKENDRTRHMMALGAQTGPVFMLYRLTAAIDAIADRTAAEEPLYDFAANDGVHHTIWQVSRTDRIDLAAAFGRVPALYIADGHHRAASAARARDAFRRAGTERPSLGDGADYHTLLAVAFPDNQVRILPYNRVVRDLGPLTPGAFLDAVGQRFTVESGPAEPARRGDIAMYFQGRWSTLRSRSNPRHGDTIAALDVSVLQDQLLGPVLGIADVTTDKRIDFVGGARGIGELERLIGAGKAVVAFSMYPVSVADLMSVSDAGAIMPPKSTWFEPKLRDGLLNHLI